MKWPVTIKVDLVKYRTLIGALVAIVALVVGLGLLEVGARAGAYAAFAAAVVAVVVALAGKGATGVLAQGSGTKGAWEALTTDRKPGEPPAPPAAGFARLWLLVGVAVLAALAAAFAAGRYTAPVRERTRTDVVHLGASMEATEWSSATREKVVEGPVRVVTRWRDAPAAPGCPPVQEVERTEERGPVTSERSEDTSGSTARVDVTADAKVTEKVTDYRRPSVALELGARWSPKDLDLTPDRIDAAVGKRIAGPLWLAVTADVETKKAGDLGAYLWGVRVRVER